LQANQPRPLVGWTGKGRKPKSTNVLIEKTTKRYGEKGEHPDFSPFLGVDQLDSAYETLAGGFSPLGTGKITLPTRPSLSPLLLHQAKQPSFCRLDRREIIASTH